MQFSTGEWVVFIIAGILILGYILGYVTNRQRAEKIFAWLKEGLSSLGEVSLGAKIPGMATGGRLEVNLAVPPLKRVEAVYLLAPRENLLFWFFHLLQGKGDELIVWVNYLSKPEKCVEVARKGDRQFEKRLKATDKPVLSRLESSHGLQVAAEGRPGSVLLGRVQAFLDRYAGSVIHLALRNEKPHLYLRLNLRMMRNIEAKSLFAALRELAS